MARVSNKRKQEILNGMNNEKTESDIMYEQREAWDEIHNLSLLIRMGKAYITRTPEGVRYTRIK